jgi:hypothetical protein
VLSPAQWAVVSEREARRLHREHKLRRLPTAKEIAEGVGVVQAESGGNAAETGGAGGASGHIGGWQEEASYGSKRERLSAGPSTRSALLHWQSSGFSWWQDWGQYETGAAGGAGPTHWRSYLSQALRAIGGRGPGGGAAVGAARAGTPAAPTPGEASGETALPTSSLMHDGLILILVLGGALLIYWGLMRMLGAARRPA